jgi:hypothetical protein
MLHCEYAAQQKATEINGGRLSRSLRCGIEASHSAVARLEFDESLTGREIERLKPDRFRISRQIAAGIV